MKLNFPRVSAALASAISLFVFVGVANAQDEDGMEAEGSASAEFGGDTEAEADVEEEVAEPPAAAVGMSLPSGGGGGGGGGDAPSGDSDHSQVVGSFGVGYRGRRTGGTGTGLLTPAGDVPVEALQAPVIGVRYWMDDGMGIDVGIGILMSGGTTEQTTAGVSIPDAEQPARSGFLLHGGVPLNLSEYEHFNFQLVPELNVGFASYDADGAGDGSGMHFDVGARVGAEVHFGFIEGLERLSLQAGVGMAMNYDTTTWEADGGDEITSSAWNLGTNSGTNPWNIFTSNVAALYYF